MMRVNFVLDSNTKKNMKELADSQHKSMSQYLRDLIKEEFNVYERRKKGQQGITQFNSVELRNPEIKGNTIKSVLEVGEHEEND